MADWKTFQPVEEPRTARVTRRFSGRWRFGLPSNITVAFEDNGEKDEYVAGLVLSAFIIFILFICWTTIIFYLRCFGREYFGFLSGLPMSLPNEQQTDSNGTSPTTAAATTNPDPVGTEGPSFSDTRQKLVKRHRRVRTSFIVLGLFYITTVFLAARFGVQDLETGLIDVTKATTDLDTLSNEVSLIVTQGILRISVILLGLLARFSDDFDGICPFDPDLSPFPELFAAYNETNATIIENLPETDDVQWKNLSQALPSVDYAFPVADDFEEVSLDTWQAKLFLALYSYVPTVLTCIALLVYFRIDLDPRIHKAIDWFFMPMFIFLNILAFVFSAAIMAVTGATSDFCYPTTDGGPDDSIRGYVAARGFGPESLVFQIVDFYLQQCPSNFAAKPYAFAVQELETWDRTVEVLNQFESGMTPALSLYCGKDTSPLKALTTSVVLTIGTIVDAIRQALDAAQCSLVVPIYLTGVPQGACRYSASALMWLFICSILLGMIGSVMVMFRSALKPTVEGGDIGNSSNEGEIEEKESSPANGDSVKETVDSPVEQYPDPPEEDPSKDIPVELKSEDNFLFL